MMSDTPFSGDLIVGNHRHHHHNHHSDPADEAISTIAGALCDECDGGDGDSLLLQSPENGYPSAATPSPDPSEDPIGFIEAALERLKIDVGVLAEAPVVAAFSLLYDTDKPAYLRLRQRAKLQNKDCSITELDKAVQQILPGGGEDPSALDALVALARNQGQLVHDADRSAVAIITSRVHREVWRVQSTGFEAWLRAAYWRAKESGVGDTTLKAALATLSAAGVNDGDEVEIAVRAARDGASYILDLCDERWRAIYVTPRGWRILEPSAALFIRTASMRALPEPKGVGDIALLWQHVNIPPERHLVVLAWLLECLRPDTPFPVLELVGEQGSAKSTTQSILRSLVDPNKVMLRGRPKTVEDIFVAAANNWLVSYENLSGLSAEQQDALCTLATGGGYAARQLYTNGEEHVMETKRPVVLNGIAVVATRPDLIDRVIHVDMPVISAAARKDDADARAAWERDRPVVFVGLLDLFSKVLGILPTVQLAQKQRMADFERLGEAVARALGHAPGEFQRQYAEMVSAGIDRALEGNVVAQILEKVLPVLPGGKWEGTASRLYELLDSHNVAERAGWPRSPKGLTDQLRRIAPAYRAKGIEISHLGHSREGAMWRICVSHRPFHSTATPPGVEGGIRYGDHK